MVERNKSTEWQFVFFTNEQMQQVGHLNRYQDIPNGLYLLINEYILYTRVQCLAFNTENTNLFEMHHYVQRVKHWWYQAADIHAVIWIQIST